MKIINETSAGKGYVDSDYTAVIAVVLSQVSRYPTCMRSHFLHILLPFQSEVNQTYMYWLFANAHGFPSLLRI